MLGESNENTEIPSEYADPEVMMPTQGQSFKTERDAYNLYNLYAVRMGFGIRLNKFRNNKNGHKTMQEFCCSH